MAQIDDCTWQTVAGHSYGCQQALSDRNVARQVFFQTFDGTMTALARTARCSWICPSMASGWVFASCVSAIAVLRADPRDPNRLDGDYDGIARESSAAPMDLVSVPRPWRLRDEGSLMARRRRTRSN